MTCRNHNGKGCSLGLFGGRPSAGVCRTCQRYEGPPRGLGDVVENVARITGAKRLIAATVGGCGCERRRNTLNAAMPFKD